MTPNDIWSGTYLFLQTIAGCLIAATLLYTGLYILGRVDTRSLLPLFAAAVISQVIATLAAWLAEPTHARHHPLDDP